MIKRVFCLMLSVLMLVGIMLCTVSCMEGNKINNAIRKTNELTDIDTDLYMKIDRNGDVTKTTQKLLINGDKAKLTSSLYGEEGQDVYFDSEYAYLPSDSGVEKMTIGEYTEKNGEFDSGVRPLLQELPYSLLNEASFESMGDKLIMEAEPTEEALEKVYGSFIDYVMKKAELDSAQDDETEIEYSDCELKIITKNGYVSELFLDFEITVTAKTVRSSVQISAYIIVNNPGQEVEFEAPSMG